MPLPTSNLASCEPSRSMRDRIDQDLHIIGEISCPQKIDMRAIIPVYPFNPPDQPCREANTQAAALLITPQFFGSIMDASFTPVQPAQINYMTLKSLLVQIAIDAADRAAMAAAGDGILVNLRTLSGTIFEGEWDIQALPLEGGQYWFGSHLRNWNAGNTLRPRMDMEFQYPYPIKMPSQVAGANNYLWMTIISRLVGGLPVSTGLTYYSIFDYVLK